MTVTFTVEGELHEVLKSIAKVVKENDLGDGSSVSATKVGGVWHVDISEGDIPVRILEPASEVPDPGETVA